MSRYRGTHDQEGLSRVLVVLGALFGALGALSLVAGLLDLTGLWHLAADGELRYSGWMLLVLAGVFVGVAVGCVRLSRDDGSGTWCPRCVARNDAGAHQCEACGAGLG